MGEIARTSFEQLRHRFRGGWSRPRHDWTRRYSQDNHSITAWARFEESLKIALQRESFASGAASGPTLHLRLTVILNSLKATNHGETITVDSVDGPLCDPCLVQRLLNSVKSLAERRLSTICPHNESIGDGVTRSPLGWGPRELGKGFIFRRARAILLGKLFSLLRRLEFRCRPPRC